MIYHVIEVECESCSHLALVEGPDMLQAEAEETFRRLKTEFEAARQAADKAFVGSFGWYDAPLGGLAQKDYHVRRRDELRKAGCWSLAEFLESHGFRRVKHHEVAIRDREDEDDECVYAQAYSQDNSGIRNCLDLINPAFAELAKVYQKKTRLEECCKPCQRRLGV